MSLEGNGAREAVVRVFRGDKSGGQEVEYRVPIEPGMRRVHTGEGIPEWWQNGDATLVPGSGDSIVYLDRDRIVTTRSDGPDHAILSDADLPAHSHIRSAIWSYDHTRILFAAVMGDDRLTGPDATISLPEEQQPDVELWSVALDGSDLRNLSNDPALRQADPGTN